MAVNPNEHEDDLARDPHLARVLEAAGGEAPPAALDAAILAAARRDVGARPQVVGNGDSASGAQLPVVRFKRNWYVPVSIAAVLVMSASLVMVVHQEKQDEIAQPPRQASMPAKPAAPLAPASAPAVEAPGPAPAMNYQAHQPLRDAAPAQEQPKLAEKTVVLRQEAAAPAPDVTAELRKKQRVEQRVEKAESTADSTRRDKAATAGAREPEAAGSVAAAPAAPAAVAPPAQAKLRAEPFPAQASRDAVQARARSEADQADRVRDAAQPAPLNVPPAAAPMQPGQPETADLARAA